MKQRTLRFSRYPDNGSGAKCGQLYIIDQWGQIYDFTHEYDNVLNEWFWYIDIPGIGHWTGESPRSIIETLKQAYEGEVRFLKWE